jgi:hypothetical protein
MVQQALNRHSQVAIPPETKFFFSFFGHSLKHQVQHLERLNADLNIQVPLPKKRIASVGDGRAFYEMMAEHYLQRLDKKTVRSFGEKTPEHTGHLPRIRQLFPSAKILVLYRDGRDVASSLSRMPWMSSDVYVNFLVWLYFNWVVRRTAAPALGQIYYARYEDIVTAPARELGKILHFLDLPYEPAVAEGWGNREGIPQREYPWKERALQPITSERVGVFRRELSTAQIEVLERLGRHALPSLGYPLLTNGRRPLSLGFLLGVSRSLARFVYRLPWQSMMKEGFLRACLFWSTPPLAGKTRET